MTGLVRAHIGLALEHADRRAGAAADQLARHGQPDDPAPDDRKIACLRGARALV